MVDEKQSSGSFAANMWIGSNFSSPGPPPSFWVAFDSFIHMLFLCWLNFVLWSVGRFAETGSWSIQLTIKELRLSLKFITFCVMIFSFIHFSPFIVHRRRRRLCRSGSFIQERYTQNFINITAKKTRRAGEWRKSPTIIESLNISIYIYEDQNVELMTKSTTTTIRKRKSERENWRDKSDGFYRPERKKKTGCVDITDDESSAKAIRARKLLTAIKINH